MSNRTTQHDLDVVHGQMSAMRDRLGNLRAYRFQRCTYRELEDSEVRDGIALLSPGAGFGDHDVQFIMTLYGTRLRNCWDYDLLEGPLSHIEIHAQAGGAPDAGDSESPP